MKNWLEIFYVCADGNRKEIIKELSIFSAVTCFYAKLTEKLYENIFFSSLVVSPNDVDDNEEEYSSAIKCDSNGGRRV